MNILSQYRFLLLLPNAHPSRTNETAWETHKVPPKTFFFFSPKGEIKAEKRWRKLQVQWTLRGKKSIGQIVSTKIRTKKKQYPHFKQNPLLYTPLSLRSMTEVLSSSFSNLTKNKRRDLVWGEVTVSSSRPRVHLSEWDFSSAVGSEVRLCDGWCCSGLLSDVVTAWAVALLVWDALREGELVHLRSLFFQLQWGFWKTKARHKNTNPWNETHW